MTLLLAAGWIAHALAWTLALRRQGARAAAAGEWPREALLRALIAVLVVAALLLPHGDVIRLESPVRTLLIVLSLGGHALAIAARASLGGAWGVGVVPRVAAPVRSGPYALLPHPIYAGTATAILAQLLLLQNLASLLLAAGALLVIPLKLAVERAALR